MNYIYEKGVIIIKYFKLIDYDIRNKKNVLFPSVKINSYLQN